MASNPGLMTERCSLCDCPYLSLIQQGYCQDPLEITCSFFQNMVLRLADFHNRSSTSPVIGRGGLELTVIEVTCHSLGLFLGTTELGSHVLFLKSNDSGAEQN